MKNIIKDRSKIIACAVIAGIVIFTGMGMSKTHGGPKDAKSDSMEIKNAADQVPVTVASAKQGSISDEIYTIGQAAPSSTYNVNAKASGEVSRVYFEVGDEVRKGDILFTVDMDSLNIDRDKNLAQLSNGVEQAKMAYDNALKVHTDKKKLFESGAVSDYDLDNSRINSENAKISYENALKNLNSTSSSYSEQTENYVIKSPVSGIVTQRSVDEGMFASSQNGFTIIVKDSMVIEASIASKYVNSVKPGQEVEIYVNTLYRTYSGEVASVSYTAKKGSYPVEISISDDDKRIQPGMYAEISIKTGSKEDAVLIPKSAVISEGPQDYVYVVDDSSAARRTPVEMGISNEGIVEIARGISAGDKVVVEGKEFLDDGKLVMVQ
ncbi:RND family efflux transporter, MFP subunit [Peptoclostridium litorale DSM 5388]|uniref:Efflux transporter, RND family, MFP subunit n=1 Tax=Peptoclostridium litorale DSM 5388 TaxID=1121324 RepID=A0A069RMT7_PEPLI|nr:efflux RND transporter periplasmic adaptor subunit [Peptoclostridium litorale]KDR95497.1 efflux transporter, RND family, MFP subunit [Peptoclostridium litorale DSM 5388]SIO17431.1 RND family efflux transporter, MFP subunit [Peptoclostridium litorale DSM 5388]